MVPAQAKADSADKIDRAQKRYFQSPKGKQALRRYYYSTKAQSKREQRKAAKDLAKKCESFLLDNPGKTADDFLKERNNG